MSKRNQMPGLRLKGKIWHIEKRCRHADGGWLRESTGKTGRAEAEAFLISRLAYLEKEAERKNESSYTFLEAGLRYLEDIAIKPSADTMAMHLDQLFPFIGELVLEQVHDATLKTFINSEVAAGKAPKTINNALGVVSAVLNRAARVWRNEDGLPWLKHAPPKLSRMSAMGKQAKAYPLSWDEQDRLFKELPRHLADAALYGINTGCREQEICQLRWDWEVRVPDLKTSVFILPETLTKTGTERIVVLNSVARRVIEGRRGKHPDHVFTYRDAPLKKLHASGWRRAWRVAGMPVEKGVLKGVHNLRHSFGRRLRSAGVSLETRKALLGHAHGDITTHYSAAELAELMNAVEKIVDRGVAQTPALFLLQSTKIKDTLPNMSEKCRK